MSGRLNAANLVALLLGVAGGFLLLEAGVRWRFEPPPPGPPILRNDDGFRDRDHPIENPEGLVRLAFIGDSYTFGQGVPLEQRFGERTAAALDEEWTEVRVDSLNFGRPGANVADVLRIYEGGVRHYRPEIVVYSFVLNDFSNPVLDAAFRQERDRILADHRARFPGLRTLAGRSRAAAVFDRLLFDSLSGIEEAQLEFLRGLYRTGPDRSRAQARIQRLTRLLARDPEFAVVVFMPYFLPDEAELDFYVEAREIVREAADRRGVAFLEVLPLLADRPFHEWWVSAADHHPNGAAHERIAVAVTRVIHERIGDSWSRFERRRERARNQDP